MVKESITTVTHVASKNWRTITLFVVLPTVAISLGFICYKSFRKPLKRRIVKKDLDVEGDELVVEKASESSNENLSSTAEAQSSSQFGILLHLSNIQ